MSSRDGGDWRTAVSTKPAAWNVLGFFPASDQVYTLAIEAVRVGREYNNRVTVVKHYGQKQHTYLLCVDQVFYGDGDDWEIDRTTFTKSGGVKCEHLSSRDK